MDVNTFKEKYLDKKFDSILLNNNNVLLNSNEHYIQFKKKYAEATLENYTLFCKLHTQLQPMLNTNNDYIVDYINQDIKTKKFYMYTDLKEQITIQQEINYILHKQEQLYNNFTQYLDVLNTHSNKISQKTTYQKNSTTEQNSKQANVTKNKFVMFFDKNKRN